MTGGPTWGLKLPNKTAPEAPFEEGFDWPARNCIREAPGRKALNTVENTGAWRELPLRHARMPALAGAVYRFKNTDQTAEG